MELMPVEIITRFVLTVQIFLQRGLLVEHLLDDMSIFVPMRTYLHSLVLLPWFVRDVFLRLLHILLLVVRIKMVLCVMVCVVHVV